MILILEDLPSFTLMRVSDSAPSGTDARGGASAHHDNAHASSSPAPVVERAVPRPVVRPESCRECIHYGIGASDRVKSAPWCYRRGNGTMLMGTCPPEGCGETVESAMGCATMQVYCGDVPRANRTNGGIA